MLVPVSDAPHAASLRGASSGEPGDMMRAAPAIPCGLQPGG